MKNIFFVNDTIGARWGSYIQNGDDPNKLPFEDWMLQEEQVKDAQSSELYQAGFSFSDISTDEGLHDAFENYRNWYDFYIPVSDGFEEKFVARSAELGLIEKETKESNVSHFVFGSQPCEVIHQEGFEAFKERWNNGGFDDSHELYVYDETQRPADILYRYNGYLDFFVLTKEEYDQLDK